MLGAPAGSSSIAPVEDSRDVPVIGRARALWWGGLAASLAATLALFTRVGINGLLSRDQAVYVYGGQQLAHGVAPYASIFDPKGPVSVMLSGLAAAVANLAGRNDVYAIRLLFFVVSCLTVVAVYALAVRLWRSVLGGVVAAVTFASFEGYAAESLRGPDAHAPGILMAVVAMLLMARQRWFLAGAASAVAFLTWQPLFVFPAVAVGAALACSQPRTRLRNGGLAVAGGAVPTVLVAAYFAWAGALGKFVESAFVFPLTGIHRGHSTQWERWQHIGLVVETYYRFSGVLFWVGLVCLVVLTVAFVVRQRAAWRQALVNPLVCVVMVTGLAEAAYASVDFQSYPDLFALLPYAALGLGGAAAAAVHALRGRLAALVTGVVLVALLVLTAFSWSWFTADPRNDGAFVGQRSSGCAVNRLLSGGGTLYALGDPGPLVLTHRRNPDRYVYLQSGVDAWKVAHTPGGFDGWTKQIQRVDPTVVTLGGWHTAITRQMTAWLRSTGYHRAYAGRWRLFIKPGTRAVARQQGVRLTKMPTDFALGTHGHRLPAFSCG